MHFVAPENLKPMPKHIVFVLDTSGSMMDKKLIQTKNAMKTILSELREGMDYMTIITFSDDITVWEGNTFWAGMDKSIVKVTKDSLADAIAYVDGLDAKGEGGAIEFFFLA